MIWALFNLQLFYKQQSQDKVHVELVDSFMKFYSLYTYILSRFTNQNRQNIYFIVNSISFYKKNGAI